MKERIIRILATILLIIVAIIIIFTVGTATAHNPNAERVGQINKEIAELEYQKIQCLDKLTYKQTLQRDRGFARYCEEYDEEIMKLQEELETLKIPLDIDNIEETTQATQATQATQEEWEPGLINESGDAQVMPPITATDSHGRFKQLAEAYGLDASTIWAVENHYGIKEGVILCITVAETSGGNRGYGKTNPGNVGNNDRGDRIQYATFEGGLEKIGQTLTNKYLGSVKTLGCLSNAGNCESWDDNGKRYATSDGNWERNMKACLGSIYGEIDASSFSIRR